MLYFTLVCLFFLVVMSVRPVAHHRCLADVELTVSFTWQVSGTLSDPKNRRLILLCRQTDLFRGAVQRLLSCLHYPTYSANSTAWESVQVVTVEQLIPVWHKVKRCVSRTVSKEEGPTNPARCVLTCCVVKVIFEAGPFYQLCSMGKLTSSVILQELPYTSKWQGQNWTKTPV